MTDKPLFSVLIANYNNAEFLDDAIESVINQTYETWEIIVDDDSSTDNSFDVLEKFKKTTNITIYFNDINRGCGHIKNKYENIELAQKMGEKGKRHILANFPLSRHIDHLDKIIDKAYRKKPFEI